MPYHSTIEWNELLIPTTRTYLVFAMLSERSQPECITLHRVPLYGVRSKRRVGYTGTAQGGTAALHNELWLWPNKFLKTCEMLKISCTTS